MLCSEDLLVLITQQLKEEFELRINEEIARMREECMREIEKIKTEMLSSRANTHNSQFVPDPKNRKKQDSLIKKSTNNSLLKKEGTHPAKIEVFREPDIEKDFQKKKKLIDQWYSAENLHKLNYLEIRALLERIFVSTIQNPNAPLATTVYEKMWERINWIYGNWDILEVSFKHREEFLSNNLVQRLVINDSLISNEQSIAAAENDLEKECKYLSNLLNFKDTINLISKRENLKAYIEQININLSQTKDGESKKLIAQRAKKSQEISQLTEKIEAKLKKNPNVQILYRGLRYREILEFDKLKKTYEDEIENQKEIQKWTARYAKKFA
jgi:hypothetical protein